MHNSTLQSGLNLWDCYQNIYFRFTEALPKAGHLAIITAWNPRSEACLERQNKMAQSRLIKQLREGSLCFWTLDAGNHDFSYFEPSLAVACTRVEAHALCQQYQQNAYYYVTGDELWLEPVLLAGHGRQSLGAFSHRLIRESI